MFSYRLDPESDVPVYRQLADRIHAEIRSGALKTGTQLPTVREMADRTHLSCGTVKRVYDRLRDLGDIDMTRRRGSFVKFVREDGDSRKLMAMNAIDDMLRRLSELNFSPREIQIFLDLKLREWGVRMSGMRIGLVTPGCEIAGAFEKQFERIGNSQLFVSDMRHMREYPYTLDEQSDVLLCTESDAPALKQLLSDTDKIVPVVLVPKREALIAAAKLEGENVVVVSAEPSFGESIARLLPDRHEVCPEIPDDADAAIVPVNLMHLSEKTRSGIEALRNAGRCVTVDYEIDAGSMLYLEERIGRLREARQLRPAGPFI